MPSTDCTLETSTISVLLADDQPLIRAALRVLVDHEEGLAVVAEAADGEEAVALARETRPDVVVMDIGMPGLDGIEATRRIVADTRLDGVKVLILTTSESDERIIEALSSGASGFLVKDADPAELLRAVRVVAQGEALLSPSVTRRLIAELAALPRARRCPPGELEELTRREREVMGLVATGLSNAEIAEVLVVSPATAKTHVSRAMLKLQAHDRAQLVVLAYQTGLVTAGGHGMPSPPVAA
jgi:DNA-binding NarL/FixJ family response regulator